MIKLNYELSLKKMFENVSNIVIFKSLKPYIYEMSCFLYSGKYLLTLSKMNYKTSKKQNIKNKNPQETHVNSTTKLK